MEYQMDYDFSCYILDDNHIPVKASLIEWSTFFEHSNRTIKKTVVDDTLVSTVFIGMNGILFETMVFNSDSMNEQNCDRTNTYEEAIIAHDRMVAEFINLNLEIF